MPSFAPASTSPGDVEALIEAAKANRYGRRDDLDRLPAWSASCRGAISAGTKMDFDGAVKATASR